MTDSLPTPEPPPPLVLGPWRFTFTPDGDDPGEGTVEWFRWRGPGVEPQWEPLWTVDGTTRAEWDGFVLGATQ